jgi:hypothetical protein
MRIYRKYDKHDNLENEIENYTPIRRGSRIFTANSFDYELMFLDRQSIIPDYNLAFLPIEQEFPYNIKSDKGKHHITLTSRFLVQNTGRNPIAITSTRLLLDSISPCISHINASFAWTGKVWVVMQSNVMHASNYHFPYHPIIVPHNEILQLRIEFWSNDLNTLSLADPMLKLWREELSNMKQFTYAISVNTSSNKTFTSEKWEVNL